MFEAVLLMLVTGILWITGIALYLIFWGLAIGLVLFVARGFLRLLSS